MRRSRINMLLAALLLASACTDRVEENGSDVRMAENCRLSFAVKTQGGWTKADGSRSGFGAQDGSESARIEMKGKTDGETFYLETEVVDGFPGDNRPMSRGTQITEANMTAFGLSSYINYNYSRGTYIAPYLLDMKVVKNADGTTFSPENNFFIPYGGTNSSMDFLAWYPYEAEGLSAGLYGDTSDNSYYYLSYTVPDDITKQQDIMMARVTDYKRSEQDSAIVPLTFKHLLSAIKFEVGKLPDCTIDSIVFKNVENHYFWISNRLMPPIEGGNHNFVWRLNKKWDASADSVLTADNETLFMVPQGFLALPDGSSDSQIEVCLTLPPPLGQYKLSAYLSNYGWSAGKTYIYRLSSDVVSMDMSFYSDQNYTSHNISANGEVADVTYQVPSGVTSLTGRWAYKTQNEAGETVYEVIESADTYPYMESVASTTVKTPVLNNLGLSGLAKKDTATVVYQVKPVSTKRLIMPDNPDEPGVRQRFNPTTDADKWYTVWKGTLYPPNYVLVVGSQSEVKNYLSRSNLKNGTRLVGSYSTMANLMKEYWEVDPDHPKFGKGKWALSDVKRMFTDDDAIFCNLTYEIQGYIYNGASPGNSDVYGEPFDKKGAYWSDGINGWVEISGGNYYCVWIFLGNSNTNKFVTRSGYKSGWDWAQREARGTKNWYYPMTSVDIGNSGVRGRGWLKCE